MVILNVDDDCDDREMFGEAVKTIDPDISVLSIESGQKALDYLASSMIMPHYAFIDINMPMMNGYECVELIRALQNTGNMSIVMYSTAFNPRDQLTFGELGIQYLIKGDNFSDLVDSIGKLISTPSLGPGQHNPKS